MPNRNRTFDALAQLVGKDPTSDDFNDYFRQTSSKENDRGAAILIATNVENALQIAIERRLTVTEQKRLFGYESPMGTFEGKIRIGLALDIFGPTTNDNLYCIKQLRNAFAHARIAISFKTEEVLNVCQLLQYIPLSDPRGIAAYDDDPEKFNGLAGRGRFQKACDAASHNLFTYAGHALQIFPWFQVPPSPEGDKYQILVRPKPLP